MKNKILIISYTFPPNQGIGGRRWAKFSKYFLRMGYDVKVITSTPLPHSSSNWDKDTERIYKEDRIVYVDKTHPKVLSGKVLTSLWDKIIYRLDLPYVKLTTKGNYWDPSKKWVNNLMPEVENQITDGYTNIVATGGPFGYLSSLVDLKDKYDNIKVSIDIRDPWTNNETGFGYDSLSKERFLYEVSLEKNVVEKSDNIISVSDDINTFLSKYTQDSNKFHLIRNGFDNDDFTLVKVNNDKIKFVFAGTLYSKALHVFEDFIHSLDIIKVKNTSIYDKLEFDFYGSIPQNFMGLIGNHTNIFKYHGFVSLDEANKAIGNSKATLLFLTDDLTYSFSTKFYEYLAQKKPIFLFSKKGDAGRFILKNKLGFGIEYGNTYNQFTSALENLESGFKVDDTFDISEYDVEYLSKEYINLLIE